MSCYAGITQDPGRRKAEHLREHPNMTNWKVVGQFNTKAEAQAWENQQTQCDRHPGGGGTGDGFWYGYTFDY